MLQRVRIKKGSAIFFGPCRLPRGSARTFFPTPVGFPRKRRGARLRRRRKAALAAGKYDDPFLTGPHSILEEKEETLPGSAPVKWYDDPASVPQFGAACHRAFAVRDGFRSPAPCVRLPAKNRRRGRFANYKNRQRHGPRPGRRRQYRGVTALSESERFTALCAANCGAHPSQWNARQNRSAAGCRAGEVTRKQYYTVGRGELRLIKVPIIQHASEAERPTYMGSMRSG